MGTVPLGEICQFQYGNSLPASLRDGFGYDVYGSNGVVGSHNEGLTTGSTVIIGRKGSVGEVNFSDNSCWPIDTTYYVDSSSTQQNLRWLFYTLKNLKLQSLNKATGVPGLNRNDAYRLKIPLPPLDEQKRIAAILDQADEIRRKRQHAIDRLNQLGQAIFHEMFGDITTNPMGWDTVKLGDVCGVGSSKRVFVEEFAELGVPFYRGTEVGKLATGEKIEPDLFISPDHYNDLIGHSGKPEIGDLLLPSICNDGRIWRVDTQEPFYFKDGRVLWIKQNEPLLDSEYLRNHLRNAFLRNYTSIASGTTFAELKIVNLKGMSVLCPPLHLQKQFSEKIRKAESCGIEMVRSSTASDSMFASLQHRAFRGEL
jgi:type I restriction enzyme S subunit